MPAAAAWVAVSRTTFSVLAARSPTARTRLALPEPASTVAGAELGRYPGLYAKTVYEPSARPVILYWPLPISSALKTLFLASSTATVAPLRDRPIDDTLTVSPGLDGTGRTCTSTVAVLVEPLLPVTVRDAVQSWAAG